MIVRTTVAATLLLAMPPVASGNSIVKSIWENNQENSLFDKRERRHLSRAKGPTMLHESRRQLVYDDNQEACDSAFMGCLPNNKCVDCFSDLQTEEVDWASVSPDTDCLDVVKFLNDGGHCVSLKSDSTAKDVFCKTFNSCVVWDDDEDEDYENHEQYVNCTALTSCEWEGMHPSFLGDGVCQDNVHGCYNTEVCGWDGGDCCEDTCNFDSAYKTCGNDGYACRDPKSESCDSSLTTKCINAKPSSSIPDPSSVTCDDSSEQKYRIVMYDSFGDGWDLTELSLAPSNDKNRPKFKGGLKEGSQGTEFVCLSKSPTCYNVNVGGGTWGIEVSWEVKSMGEGTPAIAGGGAPMDCNFSVAGAACENTCTGKPNVDPTKDPDYKTFKDLYTCISEKCVIQLGACESDPVCQECFEENAPDYCFNVDSFNAVIDCTMCSCTDRKDTGYCAEKSGPGAVTPPAPPTDDGGAAPPKQCSPAETIKGSNAVIEFSKCTDFDQVSVMVTDFDNDNFGQLDAFESCAHSYTDEQNHGGHTALGCMRILNNARLNPTIDSDKPNAPKEAIMSLANYLYNDAESFCDCSRKASDDCPLCPSFMQFKTLLYESLDACQALDEIDCDAWNEFYMPCKNNLIDEYQVADFKKTGQCEYAKKGCGGAGPFPAFRRLDCANEVPSDAWSFYNDYASNCLKGSDGIPPVPAPTPKQPVGPSPVAPTPVSTPAPVPSSGGADTPTLKPYVPPDAKPYKPSDSESNKDEANSGKKKSHWFRNLILLCLVGAGGYYYYKRRFDSFNFVQYRRNRLFGGMGGGYSAAPMGESEMYSSLNNSTTFEPPSLPPTPTSMGGSSMGGMGGMMSNMMPQGMGMGMQQQQQPQGGGMGNVQGGGMFHGMQMS